MCLGRTPIDVVIGGGECRRGPGDRATKQAKCEKDQERYESDQESVLAVPYVYPRTCHRNSPSVLNIPIPRVAERPCQQVRCAASVIESSRDITLLARAILHVCDEKRQDFGGRLRDGIRERGEDGSAVRAPCRADCGHP